MPRPLLFCLKSGRSVCYSVPDNTMMIFEGWQDLKEEEIKETLEDNKNVKITKSKYGCFDSRYIDDLENCFKNPVVIFKNYKTGVNGKIYA